MTVWNSLYCRSDDAAALAERIQTGLIQLGYESYHPFAPFPAKAYVQSVRLFIAPASQGWVRVIGALDEQLLPRLGTCLYVQLNTGQAQIAVYTEGKSVDPITTLAPYLRLGKTAADLRPAFDPKRAAGSSGASVPLGVSPALPLEALPEDVRKLAGNVDKQAADKLFARLTNQVLKKAGQDQEQAEAARALLVNENAPDWNSPGGQQISALMDCLTIPENWREPDFAALSSAYPLHERRRRNPNARLYPGDAETLAQVPDALVYTPVYAGRNQL